MNYNVLTLAYLGDSVYELYIREYLISKGIVKVNDLQKEAIKYVSAKAQASYLKELIDNDLLSKEELDSILNNINNVSREYEKTNRKVIDAPLSFAYIVVNGKKKEITTINRDTIKENISEAGKNILSVIVENNMIYIDK